MFKTLNFRAIFYATVSVLILAASIILGSRRLQNFDAALIAYLFGTVFSVFGIVYRYNVWLERPPTKLYWKRGWQFFFSGRMFYHGIAFLKHFLNDIIIQKFVLARGKVRWTGHMLMAFGCLLAFAVTLPMTFGWIHFTLKEGYPLTYEAHLFGFSMMEFHLDTISSYIIFHVLDWCSFAIIIGIMILMRRRMTQVGLMAVQTFEGDWLPLILLLAISITGLGLTWDYKFMEGKAHQFMAITHAITVIFFLVWMPFGKFFHIFQRPAQLGIAVYRNEGKLGPQAVCPHTGEKFASQLQVNDLKQITKELGFDYDKADGSSHLDLSPQGKRAALAKAHLEARKKQLFG